MPKTPSPAAPARKAAAKSAARNTDSGPSEVLPVADGDRAARKMADTEALAAAMPHNPNKPGEHGFANGVAPQ
uniref:hypothetical protein n=1 Tax=Ramlibacter sp. TaxID=1917967 RepID=UPI0017A1978F